MARAALTAGAMRSLEDLASDFVKLPLKRAWIDYDEGADVLYISFQRPQKATDSKMLENGVLIRYRGDEIVGVTILDASKRH